MLRPSRRRWWHRAAVMERPLTGGEARPISWHLTTAGALRAVDDLYAEYLLDQEEPPHDLGALKDWFAAVPAGTVAGREWYRPVYV